MPDLREIYFVLMFEILRLFSTLTIYDTKFNIDCSAKSVLSKAALKHMWDKLHYYYYVCYFAMS